MKDKSIIFKETLKEILSDIVGSGLEGLGEEELDVHLNEFVTQIMEEVDDFVDNALDSAIDDTISDLKGKIIHFIDECYY